MILVNSNKMTINKTAILILIYKANKLALRTLDILVIKIYFIQ